MIILDLFDTHHEKALKEGAVDSADQLNEYIPRRKDANYAEFAPGTRVKHNLLGPRVGTVVDVLAIPREDRRESGIPVQVGDRIYWMAPQGLVQVNGMAEGNKKKKKKSSQSLRGYFFPGYAYYGAGDSGEGGGDGGGESKNHGMEEAKGLKKRVRIVKGSEAGKTGTVGEVRHGAYKGAPKTFTVDIDGGGSIQLPKEALRLLKDQSVAEGSSYGAIMRAKEFINEDVPAAGTDTEREVAQAIYMEGRCGVLAIAINQANPERYKLGYIYEYNVPGTEDMYLDPDDFDALDPEEQQQVKLETQSWALVHAYVVDQQTQEYIDARGRHNKVPDLNYELNLTRKNVFPATSRDIVNITADMNWNDATEEWDIVKGLAAWNQLGLDRDIPKALDYAVKYLNIDLSKGSQSTPKKPVWMNPGDPLPPSSPTGTWVILGPYKNVLYRFSASTEQRASAMKDQWCKENNIDPDSNRFCRLKYDGNVRLGQPIKKQGVAEEGYGNHPSQRVDPRTGKKYVPPKSPLGQGVAEGSLNELSTQKLAQYKTAAAADAKKSDAAGNYARGDRRFRGINQATIKQFSNDAKTHASTVKEQSSAGSDAVEQAILKRIMVSHTDLLMQFGPEKVMQAAEEVAYNVGDVDEIGTSDVSAYVRQIRQILGAE